MQRKDKGFTLVELVVVVATLAIKQMNMSQFQITSPTRTFIIFLAKVNRTILCRTLTMHMKSYLLKVNMRNIRILCRNYKKFPVQTRNKIFPAEQGISFFTDYHTASLYTLWICIARYPVSVSSRLCPIHPSMFLQMSVATLYAWGY